MGVSGERVFDVDGAFRMITRSLILVLVLVASPSFAASTSYECSVDAPKVVSFEGNAVSSQILEGLSAELLRFDMTLAGDNARVDWKNSPIQMSGENPVFPTGDESGSVLFLSSGPCMFTDGACGSMLNFSKQADGNLRILITPTAFVTDSKSKITHPFLVSIEGTCGLRKSKK